MTLWQRIFGDRSRTSPVRPILLRLDLGGVRCPPEAVVEADWLPSRERAMYRLFTSSSMVLVPWRGDSTRVSLVVRAAGREGRVVVARSDNRDGAVIDLDLGVDAERLAS
jgi:hypothetical protein